MLPLVSVFATIIGPLDTLMIREKKGITPRLPPPMAVGRRSWDRLLKIEGKLGTRQAGASPSPVVIHVMIYPAWHWEPLWQPAQLCLLDLLLPLLCLLHVSDDGLPVCWSFCLFLESNPCRHQRSEFFLRVVVEELSFAFFLPAYYILPSVLLHPSVSPMNSVNTAALSAAAVVSLLCSKGPSGCVWPPLSLMLRCSVCLTGRWDTRAARCREMVELNE